MSDFNDAVFERCRIINEHLLAGAESLARDEVIKLLDFHTKHGIENYSELVNHLIRSVGLFPYMKKESASWEDSYVYNLFEADVGERDPYILHRAQSELLKNLLEGRDLAVSAPTSFGKSFIIDAFIAIKKPKNVILIVPTIALMDETRRRLYRKFSREYEIITTADAELGEKNILVFPQERALGFYSKIREIDILIVDEFYKSSPELDRERSNALIKCILAFSKLAKQRYFLAPNVDSLNENPLTKGMSFWQVDFKTVFLKEQDFTSEIKNPEDKGHLFLKILTQEASTKTLVYAGTYPEIDRIRTLLLTGFSNQQEREILTSFSAWLIKNYQPDWSLAELVKRGVGIHNGRLHRSLSQIQIKLFEEDEGLRTIVSTSSIIEGVNTSAKNVVVWRNRNGNRSLNDFTYKNIIGRGGRMFRHFVGNIFLLDKPPQKSTTLLSLELPDDLFVEPQLEDKLSLTEEQKVKLALKKEELRRELGERAYSSIFEEGGFQATKQSQVIGIIRDIKKNPAKWNGLNYVNSEIPNEWDFLLRNFLKNMHYGSSHQIEVLINYVKICSQNWKKTIPELLEELSEYEVGIDEYFRLEKSMTFNLANYMADFNVIQKQILNLNVDMGAFITKISNAFLPPVVFHLEEFGLPRMIARKIQNVGIFDFEAEGLTVKKALDWFRKIDQKVFERTPCFDDFDRYILNYFYDGIQVRT